VSVYVSTCAWASAFCFRMEHQAIVSVCLCVCVCVCV
jgi:hypothetical protein